MPIPSLNQNLDQNTANFEDNSMETDRNERHDDLSDDQSDNETEQSIEEALLQTGSLDSIAEMDPLSHCDAMSIEAIETNPKTNQSQTVNFGLNEQSTHESVFREQILMPNEKINRDETMIEPKLEPVPLYVACSSNANDLRNLLEDDQIIDKYDDDITFTYERKTGYVMPLLTDSNGLVKRLNDVVSGNLPFNLTVSIFGLCVHSYVPVILYVSYYVSNDNILSNVFSPPPTQSLHFPLFVQCRLHNLLNSLFGIKIKCN